MFITHFSSLTKYGFIIHTLSALIFIRPIIYFENVFVLTLWEKSCEMQRWNFEVQFLQA